MNDIKEFKGNLNAQGLRVAIVISRFNGFITESLLSGAKENLRQHGCAAVDMAIVWVPGAFELPIAAKKLAESGKFDAIVCLGCVIRGATSHYDLVCGEAAKGISQVALATGIPVSFGVLTTDTIEQAIERAGTKAGNKGAEAAQVAIEMATLLKHIDRQ